MDRLPSTLPMPRSVRKASDFCKMPPRKERVEVRALDSNGNKVGTCRSMNVPGKLTNEAVLQACQGMVPGQAMETKVEAEVDGELEDDFNMDFHRELQLDRADRILRAADIQGLARYIGDGVPWDMQYQLGVAAREIKTSVEAIARISSGRPRTVFPDSLSQLAIEKYMDDHRDEFAVVCGNLEYSAHVIREKLQIEPGAAMLKMREKLLQEVMPGAVEEGLIDLEDTRVSDAARKEWRQRTQAE